MRGLDAKLHIQTLEDWIVRVLTPWPWFDRSKSQLVGFSLIAGISEASRCKC